MTRTFIAIDLPTRVQLALDSFEKDLRKTGAAVSWVKVDRIHLTLKFLGDVTDEQITAIQSALAGVAATSPPFRLQPSGCGAFPTIKQMRVVWVGLLGDEARLKEIHGRVEAAMSPIGFDPEDRPFRAHLTLGRVRGRQHIRGLQEALLANREFKAEAFDVNELVLYKSELRPEGARYTPLFRAPFTGLPD
jgi:2'-5' RNA ligase